jgi:hypothetical protein
MDLEQLLSRIALALGIGLLIGVERGWRTREAEAGTRAAGIRTFAISGLLGGVVGAMAAVAGGIASAIIFGAGFVAYAAAITVFAREENKAAGTVSATTAVAGMLTFALGVYAVLGDVHVAAAAAVAAAAILALREELHRWVERITWPELRSGLVLLAMTFIALPIVPSDPIGFGILAAKRRCGSAHCELPQSLRVLVGDRLGRFSRRYDRARANSCRKVRRCRRHRRRRCGRPSRRRFGHRLDGASGARNADAARSGLRHSRRSGERYREQDRDRRRHGPRTVRG